MPKEWPFVMIRNSGGNDGNEDYLDLASTSRVWRAFFKFPSASDHEQH
jgi:hypothetical protein